ncbi:MAG: hypothetical protein ACLFS7_09025 [Desulfosudaceae bacterium]
MTKFPVSDFIFPDFFRRILPAVAALLIFFTPVTADQVGQDETTGHNLFTEKLTLISRPPEDFFIYADSVIYNEDLTKIAYVAAGDEGMRVVVNNDTGKIYDHVARGHPIMAPETDTIGYLADKDGHHYAVIDGRQSPAYDGACCLNFSPNGKHSAYVAQKEDSQFVVLDNHPLRKYDMVDQQTGVIFSPDSRHAAYIAVKNGRQRVVLDGKEHTPFDNFTEIGFSPDSGQLAYIAVKDKEYYIVQGEQASGPFDMAQSLVWSPEGKHLASVAVKQDRWLVVKDGRKINAGKYNVSTFFDKKTNEYRSAVPRLTPPVFSPDGSGFAYVKTDGRQYRIVVNGKTGPAFDRVSRVWFSQDSAHFAYYGSNTDDTGVKSVVMLDGEAGRPYDQVDRPVFSPDFRHQAYRARKKNQWCVVYDQTEGKFYDQVGNPVFSPDFERLAYPARENNQWCVVTDQSEGEFYDEVAPPYFSPDSQHVVYRARKNDKYCLVIDGEEQQFYDEISHLEFSSDSSQWAYRAKKGDAWLIVRDKKEGKPYQIRPPEFFQPVDSPVFSPDGNHLIYTARTGDSLDKAKLVVDEHEGDTSFMQLKAPFVFDSETSFHTIVGQIEDEKLIPYRLDINLTIDMNN